MVSWLRSVHLDHLRLHQLASLSTHANCTDSCAHIAVLMFTIHDGLVVDVDFHPSLVWDPVGTGARGLAPVTLAVGAARVSGSRASC